MLQTFGKMKQTPEIVAISFDGDATLWDFQKVMRHSLAIALDELRRRVRSTAVRALTVDRMIEIRHGVGAELQGKTVNLEEIRLAAFERTLEAVGCGDGILAAKLNALYLRHRFEDIELYPDVIPALDALRGHYRLGLLSNGNGYPERCGLPGRFSFVVFSQDIGIEKPDPAIFAAACEQAGCRPAELMHVGDSLRTDIAGANAAGAVSVWLNRSGAKNSSDILPDYEVRTLAELPGIAGCSDRSVP
ncbi:MAG: HAD-IA family hydrolase [Chitinivibrionales bacterium]|nr:HAD-IA family hydrolase [Chitinivibrionales bacterium]